MTLPAAEDFTAIRKRMEEIEAEKNRAIRVIDFEGVDFAVTESTLVFVPSFRAYEEYAAASVTEAFKWLTDPAVFYEKTASVSPSVWYSLLDYEGGTAPDGEEP